MSKFLYLKSCCLPGSIAVSVLMLIGGILGASLAAQSPDYQPAHTVIKCPYIPKGLEPPTCNGVRATCVGTNGHDLILGTDTPDVIVAGPGNDVVHGCGDNDTICGGPGNDSLMGARGDDTLLGEEGNDWLFGAAGTDNLYGGPGDFDVLWGGPGFDHMDGGSGNHDVCMLQMDMGDAEDGCETFFPPLGHEHEQEFEPGILRYGR